MARSQEQAGVLQFRCSAIEPRGPIIVAVVVVFLLLAVLPSRVRVFPDWVPWLTLIALIVPMAALALNTATGALLRIERIVTAVFLIDSGFRNNRCTEDSYLCHGTSFIRSYRPPPPYFQHCRVGHNCAPLFSGVLADRSGRP